MNGHSRGHLPSSRPPSVHEAFIKKSYEGEIVGHNSRDSTAIEAREKPLKKEPIQKIAVKRGRALNKAKYALNR